jgi:hypothetical protein
LLRDDETLSDYEKLDVYGKLLELEEAIDELTIAKNTQWYSLMGFIYGLVKLGFNEEFLLSRSPIEIILISSKAREIETEIAEDAKARLSVK